MFFEPPPPDEAHGQAGCALPQSIQLSAREPWHWLAGQQIPLDAILQMSTCNVELLRKMPKLMEALAQSAAGNVTATMTRMGAKSLAAVSREAASLWRSHLAVSRHVPRQKQTLG